MKASLISTLVLFSSVCVFRVEGQEKTCADIKKESEEKKMAGMSICMQTMNFKSAESSCIMKCLLTNAGVLNGEGKLDLEQLEKRMDERAPSSMRAKAKELLDVCTKEHGPKLNPADETCKTYEPLAMCLLEIAGKVCP